MNNMNPFFNLLPMPYGLNSLNYPSQGQPPVVYLVVQPNTPSPDQLPTMFSTASDPNNMYDQRTNFHLPVTGNKRKEVPAADEEHRVDTIVGSRIPGLTVREKNKLYVIDGLKKKWNGKRFVRCCSEENCGKMRQSGTDFCKLHFKRKAQQGPSSDA